MGILSQPLTWLLPGLIIGLLAYLLAQNAGRINRPLVVLLGLVTVGLYALPFPISTDSLGDANSIALFFTSLLLLPALAWFSAALLLSSSLSPGRYSKSAPFEENEIQPSPGRIENRYTPASLILSTALLFVSLQHLYWIFAWDATTDPIGVILQIPVMWIAVGAALLLVLLLWGHRRWVGVTASALFLAAVIAVIQLAMRFDFRQITENRAGQVSQAVERRFTAVGSYPNTLEELEPWYLWSVPEPMIIYGLDWCYEGGGDYFHLGYMTREHWSSPELIARSYSSAGTLPDQHLDCSTQIAALNARTHGNFFVIDNK